MRYRWVYINGEAIPADQFEREPQADHHVMPDIQPYQSMADGTMITSRSQHREHLKRNHLMKLATRFLLLRPSLPESKASGMIWCGKCSKPRKNTVVGR